MPAWTPLMRLFGRIGLAVGLLTAACAGQPTRAAGSQLDGTTGSPTALFLPLLRTTPAASGRWQPTPGTSWQWQLTGELDLSVDAEMFDLDLFDTSEATVRRLHEEGRSVVCYLSAGSWEDWRPDAGTFPPEVLGQDYEGWPGERWLDIRRLDLIGPIMQARLDQCRAKGFDGVEPDNVDGYQNDTGFALNAGDQLAYNRWLAHEAHRRGLSIGLKNDADQAADLVADFDWALTEDCFAEGWCEAMSVFIGAGKAVFAAEYTDSGLGLGDFCSQARSLQFGAILKERDLTAFRHACP